MDILRFIIRLPFTLARGVYAFLWLCRQFLSFLLSPIIGGVSWEAPAWLTSTIEVGKKCETFTERHARGVATATALVIVALFGGYFAYIYYQNLPKPIEIAPIEITPVTLKVIAPYGTDYNKETLTFSSIRLRFSDSAAPTDKIGKEITEGIQLSPDKKGVWTWASDETLSFTPAEDWQIGEDYKITIDPKRLLAPQVEIKETHYSFQTASFKITVPDHELYQNPDKPSEKNVIYKVQFSHPVNAQDFEKRVTLALLTLGKKSSAPKPYHFAIKYDQKKLTAWIRSEQVALPDADSEMVLTIADNARSVIEGKSTTEKVISRQEVWGAYRNIFTGVNATLAENDQNEPIQILALSLMDAIDAQKLEGHVKAWLLPLDKPAIADRPEIKNYYWGNNPGNIEEDILKEAAPLPLTLENSAGVAPIVGFRYRADPNRFIYVSIDKNLETVGGYKANKSLNVVTRVPEFPKVLKFANQGAILSLYGEKKIGVLARGIEGLQLEVKRVIPSQLHHLFPLSASGQFVSKRFDRVEGNEEYGERKKGVEHFTETFVMNRVARSDSPTKSRYMGLDLDEYMVQNGKYGVFILRLNRWNPKKNEVIEFGSEQRLVVVTDLGLIAKESADGSLDVFAQSLRDNKPKSHVTVSVLGKNGSVLAHRITDAEGHVAFKSLKHYKNEQEPALILAEINGDVSFLPAPKDVGDRELEFSRFDVGGSMNVMDAGQLNTYLFSDRGLYRPGDTVNIGLITRAENWAIPVEGVPAKVTVYDPRGEVFEEALFPLDKTGFNEFHFAPPEDAPTGDWSIHFTLARDFTKNKNTYREGVLLGSTQVSIREFEPDRMKVSLTLTGDRGQGWVKPEALKATLSAQNLFGTPAQNRRVTAKLIAQPTAFAFQKFSGYRFYDGAYHPDRQFEITLEDAKTDDEGKANLALHLEEHERASYRLSIFAEAFEAGAGRGVATTETAFVSPNDYMVGAKPDGEMDYINQNDARALAFIAVTPDLNTQPLSGLSAHLIEEKYTSVLTLQDSGVYKYQSKLQEIPISTEPFAIEKAGTRYLLDTKKAGAFKIVVKNAENDILYKAQYRVAGKGNIDRSLTRSAELQVKLSKKEYQQGETIELAIDAPYAGIGLITIEKEKVYAWKWFKADTTGTVQKITVPHDLKGNGYVNVQFARGAKSNELFLSPLSYSVEPFKVKATQETATLSVESTDKVKPGKPVKITVTTSEPQKVLVYAVDEGILQVANYRFMNPLLYFFEKRRLEVKSFQILDLILPEFSHFERLAMAVGGDEMMAKSLLAGHLNPFKRKTDKPVTYWSEMVEVKGKKSLTFTPPDYFNGTLRVMAVAVSENKIGAAQTKTIVRDDFILTPNAPYVAAPDDEIEITLGVANNLESIDKPIPITLSLAPSAQFRILGDATATLTLPQKAEGMTRFKVKATDQLGNGTLTFKASYVAGGEHFETTRAATVSIRPASPYRTETLMSRMSGETETLSKTRTLYDDHAVSKATLAYSPLILMEGLSEYLTHYSHLCSEQLLGKAFNTLLLNAYQKNQEKLKISLSETLKILRARQNSEGAIGMWYATTSGYSSPFIGNYAALYLIEARERGIAIPKDFIGSLNRYLRQNAADSGGASIETLRQRAFSAYLLTRQSEVTTAQLAAIQKDLRSSIGEAWQDDATALYLAATYKMLKMDREADALLKKPWANLSRAYSESWWTRQYYDPLVINAQAIYLITKHFPEKADAIPPQALENMLLMLRQNRFTTTSAAMSLLALDSYGARVKTPNASGEALTIDELLADAKATPQRIATLKGVAASANFSQNAVKLILKNTTQNPAWYAISQSGFDRTLSKTAIQKGLEVSKTLTDDAGRPISAITLGQTVNVVLRARAHTKDPIPDIALVDLIPGGFEIVYRKPSAATASDHESSEEEDYHDPHFASSISISPTDWFIDYHDVREDRVIIYGGVSREVKTFTYQIKPTNVGVYTIPPAFAEAMYDREIQATSEAIGSITVTPPK